MNPGENTSDTSLALTSEQFREVATLIYQQCRIQLPIEKINLVRGRLMRRMADLNLHSIDEYIFILKRDLKIEMPFLISSMTTNVTSFFREQRQLDFFLEKTVPPLMDRAERGHPIRIWSAGCSTGEEPYTIAAILSSVCGRAAGLNVKILATDIDRKAISFARRGKFDQDSISTIPARFREKLFLGGSETVLDSVRGMINFNELNLFSNWDFEVKFDAIFCRNVCIYFDASSCDEVWRKFSGKLKENGSIFVGSSEKISKYDSLGLQYFGDGVYGK